MAEQDEFARLLRGWRRRTAPAEPGPRRRTPGLRREELAVEAGVSADYVVQLEQGRAQRPSAPVVAALARSLRLSPEETRTFFLAAGLAEPDKRIDRALDPGLSRLLSRAEHVAAAVYSADWWLLAWNQLWSALLGDPGASTGFERNLVWQVFTRDDWRPLPRDRSLHEFKQSLAEDLRSATLEHPLDERLAGLVDELLRARPQFASAWEQALAGQHPADRKLLRHPTAGELFLDADTFQIRGTGQHLVVYSAEPGSDDEARLAALADPGVGTTTARL